MQLPLSASALVLLGVGAIVAGVLILVVLAVRRRMRASGSRDRYTPHDVRGMMSGAAEPAVARPATPAAEDPADRSGVPAARAGDAAAAPASASASAEPVHAAPEQPGATPPAGAEPVAGSVGGVAAAAALRRAMELSPRVEPRADGPEPAVASSPAQVPASHLRHQAGSGRTVAAAVAQAFAVRAAAGRAAPAAPNSPSAPPSDGTDLPQQPLPAPEGGGRVSDADVPPAPRQASAPDVAPGGVEPPPALPDVRFAAVVQADPPEAAQPAGFDRSTGPDLQPAGPDAPQPRPEDVGPVPRAEPARMPERGVGPEDEVRRPDPTPDGDQQAATAALGSDGNGRAAGPEPDGGPPAPEQEVVVAGSGAWTTGWNTVPEPRPEPHPEPSGVPQPEVAAGDGRAGPGGGSASDARDRLLSVLLDDPERAVGAVVELEACLPELNRLSDAMRRRRAVVRDVLHRLGAAGLRPEQLARLAGMPLAEVEELLGAAPAEQQVWGR